ncbi:MAG TPA: hypothetical protein VKR31_15265 [Rhizomicrobium sp.]|nr:hypothetical protein [Rhizomicrobium sp.]
MRVTDLGRVLFALSLAALGGLTLFLPGFGHAWAMVPKWIPAHDAVAMASAAILLAGSIALLVPRTSRPAALVLAVLLLVRLVLLHARPVIAHPLVVGTWEEFGESLVFVAGAWTIFSLLAQHEKRADFGNVRVGQILFALATLPFGLAHFVYLDMTAPLIPSWLPFHVQLAYFTGAAWIAGGLSILSGVLARLAATLTAIMVSLFTILVWVPVVIVKPADPGNLSEICVSAAITGAAWVVAGSFRGRLWHVVQGRSVNPIGLAES